MRVEWAGVPFLILGHHEGRIVRAPGLWAFVRREASGEHTMLWVDHADDIAAVAGPPHARWADALRLGLNELHVCLAAKTRIDRLQLRAHLVRRTEPLLNVLEEAHPPSAVSAPAARRARA